MSGDTGPPPNPPQAVERGMLPGVIGTGEIKSRGVCSHLGQRLILMFGAAVFAIPEGYLNPSRKQDW